MLAMKHGHTVIFFFLQETPRTRIRPEKFQSFRPKSQNQKRREGHTLDSKTDMLEEEACSSQPPCRRPQLVRLVCLSLSHLSSLDLSLPPASLSLSPLLLLLSSFFSLFLLFLLIIVLLNKSIK